MTIKTITKFNFPVGEEELSQDAYYQALSEASSGFYPFGENGLWHGGIHIDEGVLKAVDNDNKLRCMAHGEVIAYRINDVYPKIVYPDNVETQFPYRDHQKVAYFSTSFTLVRHCLQMPKIKGATETPPSITLYSLYMHQLDWYGYQQKQNNNTDVMHPHFWSVTSGKVNPETKENIKGSVIRINGSKTEIVGLLLKGSKIRLAERKGTSNWYKITSISDGSLITSQGVSNQLGNIQGYVWHQDVTPAPTGKSADTTIDYQIDKEDNSWIGTLQAKVEVKGITVYAAANETQKLSYLPITASFEFDGQENGYGKIRKITGCFVPAELNNGNGGQDSPHQGYVKLASVIPLTFKPEKLDEIVVLTPPVPINKRNFIGYLGHNVSQKGRFDEPKEAPIATIKRPSDNKLPQLAHIELFTCDDLPKFINQTRTLADKLPEKEQTIVLIEKEARLIKAPKPDGYLSFGVMLQFISNVDNYYVKIKPEYTLNAPSTYFNRNIVIPPLSKADPINVIKSINDNPISNSDKIQKYMLTQEDKTWLVNINHSLYPELTADDIPTVVELISSDTPSIFTQPNLASNDQSVRIRFCVENKQYWIESKEVSHLQGQSGQLNAKIAYWNNFPLTLDKLPTATEKDTVFYPRTLSIESLKQDDAIAIDENDVHWAYVTAANIDGIPIKGWVNITKNAQEHVKRVTPWHWPGFNTIEEKATVAELSDKIAQNKMVTLDLADYTEVMSALHHILTQSTLYSTQRKKPLPPFTYEYLKEGLRRSWTAEQIGHLLLKYESEWYADDTLSKWNEIDQALENEKQQQKNDLEEELNQKRITKPYEREYALDKLNETYEIIKKNWKIEKEQRIKPSLWWKKVAQLQAQATQSTSDNQTNTNDDTPKLTNLSTDGKAWFIHPVAMVDYFAGNEILFQKGDKHEIIREINIRLAGFGGNVPTDEFTDRTENMIKQFQRDYMKVEETGVVDMKVIEAIDKFQEEYPIGTYFEQAKCQCSTLKLVKGDKVCGGFGLGKYSEQKQKKDPIEMYRQYEYPGLHRTLFWVLRAWKFYLTHFDQRNMEIELVKSGYRCWSDNNAHNRATTNHMGKALDIHMVYNNPKITLANLCDNAREVMIKYCNAYYRWDVKNVISLEAGNRVKRPKEQAVAPTWVHFDVRSFELDYLKDEYFAKSVEQVNGLSMRSLIANKD